MSAAESRGIPDADHQKGRSTLEVGLMHAIRWMGGGRQSQAWASPSVAARCCQKARRRGAPCDRINKARLEHSRSAGTACARSSSKTPPSASPRHDFQDSRGRSRRRSSSICCSRPPVSSRRWRTRAELLEVLPGLEIPVARTGHLLALKVLSRDEARPQDAADIQALLRVLDAPERDRALAAARLIASRGFARGKDVRAKIAAL